MNRIYLCIEICSCEYMVHPMEDKSIPIWRLYQVNFYFCMW